MSDDLLVDTQVALWFLHGDKRVLTLLEDALDDDASTVTLSVVSTFEIAIKSSIGKLKDRVDDVRNALVGIGFLELPITSNHASAYETIPVLHRDPFDRMLMAQAKAEDLTLVTVDRTLGAYRDVVKLRGV